VEISKLLIWRDWLCLLLFQYVLIGLLLMAGQNTIPDFSLTMVAVSFEEFHTVRKRQRSQEASKHEGALYPNEDRSRSGSTKSKSLGTKELPAAEQKEGMGNIRQSLGRLLEQQEVQLITTALIYLDLIASTFRIVLQGKANFTEDENHRPDEGSESIHWLIRSFTSFTLFFFMIEIASLIFAFGTRCFWHLGYVADIIIIMLCLSSELTSSESKAIRLLGFLRIWRFSRLVSTTLDMAQDQHNATKSCLQEAQQHGEKLRAKVSFLEERNMNEIEHRKEVEKMLQGYKEEVEMLGEALKIAAFDVAGAAIKDFQQKGHVSPLDHEDDEFFDGIDEDRANKDKTTPVITN